MIGRLMINEYGADAREIRLPRKELRIGRDPTAELVLADPESSRWHARITRRGDRFVLQDLESTNGTTLNGKKVTVEAQRGLKDGDIIRIGRSSLTVILEEAEEAPRQQHREVTAAKAPDESLCLFRMQKVEAKLLVVSSHHPTTSHVLNSDRVRIGRDPGCDIVLDDESVSPDQAEIVYNRDGFHIVDRDSSFGTFVNGVSVTVSKLENHSFLRFGKIEALFVFQEDQTNPEPPFELRDHLIELYPEETRGIQEIFQASRARGRDFAEGLVAQNVLTPEQWWVGITEFEQQAKRNRKKWLGSMFRRR